MTQEEVEKIFAGLSPYFAYKQGLQDAVAYTWDSFRREAAKDLLCAVLSGGISAGAKGFIKEKEAVIQGVLEVTDELIKQLREEKK